MLSIGGRHELDLLVHGQRDDVAGPLALVLGQQLDGCLHVVLDRVGAERVLDLLQRQGLGRLLDLLGLGMRIVLLGQEGVVGCDRLLQFLDGAGALGLQAWIASRRLSVDRPPRSIWSLKMAS